MGWVAGGSLSYFTNEAMKSQRVKKSRVSDKLIGRICGPQGLVLMWRPDGWDGMPANPPLSSPRCGTGSLERKDLSKRVPQQSDCSSSSRSLTKTGLSFTLAETAFGMCSSVY